LILATLGSMTLVISSHFASFFLGLEILSVSLFTLIAYQRKSPLSAEAAIKYLVLAGISSSFLLFGMALIYLELGTMEFARIATSVAGHAVLPVAVLVGTGMIIVGVGFKLAVVPFHMWTPDVYEGASSPVAALIATTSKGSVLALLFRYLAQTGASNYSLSIGLNLVAVFSMFVGNFLALRQENVKRVLAYSSISHMGYMLITFQTQLERGAAAVTFYLITYTVSILIAFSAIALLARNGEDEPQLMSYRGLFWRRPLLGVALSASLLSLAGIPLTAGFLGKFLVLTASVESRLWIPIAALVLSSAIGLYYYLRIVSVLFLPLAEGATFDSTLNPSLGSVSLVGLMILLLWFGVFPSTMIHWVQEAVASLSYSSAQL